MYKKKVHAIVKILAVDKTTAAVLKMVQFVQNFVNAKIVKIHTINKIKKKNRV